MKRDNELIIKILKQIEEEKTLTNVIVVEIEGYDDESVQYHVGLLKDAGYVIAKRTMSPVQYYISEMTWIGHDFLDAARDEGVVSKAKETAKQKGIEFASIPLDIAKELLMKSLKGIIGLD
ncbi:DUF2513 domain-containing protein [Paenibacillus spongiae]|uniref:DUF2513 domain-containing protein n=1 Tax=Paenibacillus spongiae TaxID=2909671 RepID=A0ABY5SEZ8_9BACL|nr:DUF2513 domain-containing protein [Paenibacillus spongiae]UVI32108.1 DUF2513 domain-containing protein [Paenibacillus spongiae]